MNVIIFNSSMTILFPLFSLENKNESRWPFLTSKEVSEIKKFAQSPIHGWKAKYRVSCSVQ